MNQFVLKYRLAAAAALVLGLAACGGNTTVSLGGTVNGLITSGLVLANGGQTVSIPANATSYVFPSEIDDASSYAITVQTQPPRLTCVVQSGSGVATGIKINAANVFCQVNTYSVGGTVNGLKTSGLILSNGANTLAVNMPVAPATTTTFTMPFLVEDAATYGIVVKTQPTGQICTVSNGTAIMGAANVTNVVVNCI